MKLKLHWQILIAIALACLVGLISDKNTAVLGVQIYPTYEFIGTLFLNALRMLIIPLIISSIISGMANLQDSQAIARLGTKTIIFYLISSLLAIFVGLLLVNWIAPGQLNGQAAGVFLGLVDGNQSITNQIAQHDSRSLLDIFLRLIPANVLASAARGEMLGLIFFSLLFGFFTIKIPQPYKNSLKTLWQACFEVMMAMTMFIMRFAPIGVFALIVDTIIDTGFAAFEPLMGFFFTVVIALAIHSLFTLPILLIIFAKISPIRFIKALSPALLTAFSTASSSATLPITMECVEQHVGVSNQTTSFVLPLGATINMDGTALYECVAAMFIAQVYGINLSFSVQFIIVVVALLTSIGVAGIPAASLVAISIILGAVGLPIEAIGLILITDRFLDMFRTAVNIYSDSCGAAIIGRSEGDRLLI